MGQQSLWVFVDDSVSNLDHALNDPTTGDQKDRGESSNGDDAVTGYRGVADPDGVRAYGPVRGAVVGESVAAEHRSPTFLESLPLK